MLVLIGKAPFIERGRGSGQELTKYLYQDLPRERTVPAEKPGIPSVVWKAWKALHRRHPRSPLPPPSRLGNCWPTAPACQDFNRLTVAVSSKTAHLKAWEQDPEGPSISLRDDDPAPTTALVSLLSRNQATTKYNKAFFWRIHPLQSKGTKGILVVQRRGAHLDGVTADLVSQRQA